MRLKFGPFEYAFPRPAVVMGIVNVTPDSFSDGGDYLDPDRAAARAFELVEEGADWIDIGGESTRPFSEPVSEAEELRRVRPVLERVAGRLSAPVSIDTVKPGVAKAALAAGACIINDVAANRSDPAMWRLAAETGAGYIAMHMQGAPRDMQRRPEYADVAGEVEAFLEDRLKRLAEAGVDRDQVLLDVGVGFGKTAEHNLRLLAAYERFTKLGRPLVLGVSRKSFIGKIAGGANPEARTPGSLACAVHAVSRRPGFHVIRTHDVAATRQALRLLEAILERSPDP